MGDRQPTPRHRRPLTLQEAARALRCREEGVIKLYEDGKISGVRRDGSLYILPDSLAAYLAESVGRSRDDPITRTIRALDSNAAKRQGERARRTLRRHKPEASQGQPSVAAR
jgi:phage terminase large subunit-like protein